MTGTTFDAGDLKDGAALEVTTAGTVSAFSVQLQGSIDGVNWVSIGSPLTTATTSAELTGFLARWFRAVLSGFSGTGTVTARIGVETGAGFPSLTQLDARYAALGPVASRTLAAPAAGITFSAIPQGFSVLRVLAAGASASVSEGDRWLVTVNGDGGLHYDTQMLYGTNTTVIASPKSAQAGWVYQTATPGDLPGASATAGSAGILEITLPNYAGTALQKVGRWFSGYSDAATAAADQVANTALVAWRSSAAITSVTLTAVSGANLVTGTAAYLFAS